MSVKVNSKKEHVDKTYREQKGKLLNFIKRSLPLDQAEDVLQDVFIQLFSGYEQIENVTSWLYRAATNKIIDVKRKKKPELFGDKKINSDSDSSGGSLYLEDILPALSDGPEDELFRRAIWEEIMETLEELPEEQKEVFVLHEFEDYSFENISRITGEKINTLISRKRYAVLYLRERLNEMYRLLKD